MARCQLGQRHPLIQSQAHHQHFGNRVPATLLRDGFYAVAIGLDTVQPASRATPRGQSQAPTANAQPPMRAGANADPVLGPP